MTTQDAAAGGTATGTEKRRFNLAPVQKFGRSLMLPIAALPVAALLLRLGQPDLLGAHGVLDQLARGELLGRCLVPEAELAHDVLPTGHGRPGDRPT